MSRTHWHLRITRSQERGNEVLLSPGTNAIEPWHSLPCTQLPFSNWQNVIFPPLKSHCRSKAACQSWGPRTEWLFTCRAFLPKKLSWCSAWDAVHSQVIRYRIHRGNGCTSIPQNHREVCCAVCNGPSERQPWKFCFLHTNWKDKLLWKKKPFLRYILYFKAADHLMWRGLHCSANGRHPI